MSKLTTPAPPGFCGLWNSVSILPRHAEGSGHALRLLAGFG